MDAEEYVELLATKNREIMDSALKEIEASLARESKREDNKYESHLRDQFASGALNALINRGESPTAVVGLAYKLADAMLKERNKNAKNSC